MGLNWTDSEGYASYSIGWYRHKGVDFIYLPSMLTIGLQLLPSRTISKISNNLLYVINITNPLETLYSILNLLLTLISINKYS